MSSRDLGLVLLICLAWAFNFLTSAHALREIPPFMFTALRLGLLVAVLAPFVRAPSRPASPACWCSGSTRSCSRNRWRSP